MNNKICYFRETYGYMSTSVFVESPIREGSEAYIFEGDQNQWKRGVVTGVADFTDKDLYFGDFCAELCSPDGDCTVGIEQIVPCEPPVITEDCITNTVTLLGEQVSA